MSFKFNPFSGKLDTISPKNFSFNYILTGQTLVVPLYQQMIVAEHLDIAGDIDLLGDLAII